MTDFVYVYTGAAPNDGTGNSIRDSFTILNDNFHYIHNNIWPDQSQNDLTANITSSYISRFNLIQCATVYSESVGNVGTGYFGETYIANVGFEGPLGTSGGNSAIVSTLSATGNVTVANLFVNGSSSLGAISISSLNDTVIGNVSPTTGAFTLLSADSISVTYDVTLNNSNIGNVRYIGRSVSNLLNTNLAATTSIGLGFGTIPQYSAVSVNVNVTLGYSAITTGVERLFVFRNWPDGTARQITLPSNFNNKGTTIIPIAANSSVMMQFIPFSTDSANVYVNITNN